MAPPLNAPTRPMNAHPLLTAVLVVLCATSLLAFTNCQPDCNGHAAGDKVQDPWDCTQFYVCVYEGRPSDHTIACPTNTVFDQHVGDCIPGSNCEATCNHMCHMTCTSNMDLIQDPKNCNVYYMCDENHNTVGPYMCPSDRPYFDGEKCTDDDVRCCQNSCTPYCYASNTYIPDPFNCAKYYMCVEVGPADQAGIHFDCKPGSTFQYSSGTCKEGAPCVTLCNPDASSTTSRNFKITTIPPTTTGCNTMPHHPFPHLSGHML